MIVLLNGEARECSADSTVLQQIEAHALLPATTLVEYNGQPLPRSEWARQRLTNGDRLEILRVAAGG